MTKHDDYITWQQGAEIARQLMDLKKAQRKSTRAAADLRHAAIDGGPGVKRKDIEGNLLWEFGDTGIEHVAGPVPAQPAVPHVDAGQRVVKVQLSGLDADEGPAPTDFWRAEIHVSLDKDFEPSLSTLATYIDEPNGSATHSLPAGEWYVGVVWVTLSKQRSVMSDLVVADIEPPVDAEEIEADLEDARQRIQDAREYADEQFEAFDVRVESAETDLNDAHDRIDAAEGALSTTQSDLDDAKADITAAQSAADQAIADALAAADLAEGKGQVITQVSAPTGSRARAENLWVRLPDMKVHYYDGDKWKPVLDPDTIAAAQQAANALTKANDLQTKHDALKLAVDGEGGLKDRLGTAENTLETKADESALDQLDQKLAGDLAAFEAHYTRIWRQATPPPPGVHYEWLGERHGSVSVRLDSDGNELARNLIADGRLFSDPEATARMSSGYDDDGYLQLTYNDGVSIGGYAAFGRNSITLATGLNDFIGGTVTFTFEVKSSNGRGTAIVSLGSGLAGGYRNMVGGIGSDFTTVSLAVEVTGSGWRPHLRFFNDEPGVTYTVRHAKLSIGDQVEHYFDGDKASDRANDLWYDADGVPHEWVNGQGWVELSDDRINQLQTDVVEAAQTAYLDRLVVRDEIVTPETITNRLWADLGVFNRLQAREGWIGGVNLADGAVTAEKIHATREMITKIMGAEWAYIAEQLVVDGKIIANNADIISAVIKNLDVTEQSNFVDAFAEQLRTKEFTALVATMARAIIAAPNQFPDPDFQQDNQYSPWSVVDNGIQKYGTSSQHGTYFTLETIPAEPKEQFNVSGSISWIDGTSGRTTLMMRSVTNEGTSVSGSVKAPVRIGHADEGFAQGVYEVPDNPEVAGVQLGFYTESDMSTSTRVRIEQPRVERMTDGRLLIDGTVDTRHLNVTEEMVASFARILHLVVDQIDVNKLWADTTWQQAGHFGSQDGDYQTRVDGTGLQSTHYDTESELETVMLRIGALFGLIFADENGQITGSLSNEGDANLRDVSMESLTIRGRQLLPTNDPAEHWDGNLWDSQPKGLICFHEENMAGISVNHTEYGFIEVSHHVKANRKYRVTTNNFIINTPEPIYGRFRYTIGENPEAPHTQSPQLGNTWQITTANTRYVQQHGNHIFTPDQDGLMRILLTVARQGNQTGIEFHSSANYARTQLRLEDLGPTHPYTGMTRIAGHGGSGTVRDPKPLTGAITTEWEMDWYQNYSHGGTQRRSSSQNPTGYGAGGPTQGARQDSAFSEGVWRSVFGHTISTESTNPNDLGISVPAALNGVNISSAYLEVMVAGSHNPQNYFHINVEVRPANTSPTTYTALASGGLLLDTIRNAKIGQVLRIPLPLNQVEAELRNGGAQSFGLFTNATAASWSGWLSWNNPPKLVITYTR